ncbi:hypothetical protein [Sphingobium yanoikuyae]|uniref:Uncharacterized protein n=1 Tax=Sphingobium yanoikuyae TaxID=13690 RepID=A0A291N085_SPHYA|nr:hypothetical protein [Sphingobium yanoikuyae]ATI80762.1 hypothetical protein A6768_12680 [Sphingobium yanoikuyae]
MTSSAQAQFPGKDKLPVVAKTCRVSARVLAVAAMMKIVMPSGFMPIVTNSQILVGICPGIVSMAG